MIESAGGMIPFLCHIFLILFGGFFGRSFSFNKNFVNNSIGYGSKDCQNRKNDLIIVCSVFSGKID